MDYDEMYKMFKINETHMCQLNDMTKMTMMNRPLQENVIIKTIINDKDGSYFVNEEVANAELV